MPLDKWTSGKDYDAWMGRWSRLLAKEFLVWLNIPAGARWLDVCCGTGITTQAIVEHSSPASVAGIDVNSAQMEVAREHRSHPKVSYELADAMALPFENRSFDAAICGLSLQYIPDPHRALSEMRRTTRPGGTVAVYVWDFAQGARFLRLFWDAAAEIDPGAAEFDQARRFPLCTPEGLRAGFAAARLESPVVKPLEIVTRFASFDDYWEPMSTGQGSAPHYLSLRDERTRLAIRDHLKSSLPADAHGAIVLAARAWAIRASHSPRP
jgi:SAM-dependent methyltransferase